MLYDYTTLEEGRGTISNGWKAASITEAIERERGAESLDPFFTFDPMVDNDDQTIEKLLSDADEVVFFITPNQECEDEEVWEFKGGPLKNAFDIFNDNLYTFFVERFV